MIKRYLVSIFLFSILLFGMFRPTPVLAWERDKALHFLAGGGISGTTYVSYRFFSRDDTTKTFNQKRAQGFVIGLSASLTIGAAKEIVWDGMLGKGIPDFQDFLAITDGALVGGVLSLYIDGWIHRRFSKKNENKIPLIMINPLSKTSQIQLSWKF